MPETLPGPEPFALEREVPATPVKNVAEPKPAEAEPLLEALLCFLKRHPEQALTHLNGYNQLNQDLLLCLLPLAVFLTEGSLDQANPQEIGHVVDQLNSLLLPLRARAPLVVDKMHFCKTIHGHGRYDPLPHDHKFRPGELVQVYVELRNMACEQQDRLYVSHLSSSMEVRDVQKRVVWRQDFPEDHCRPDRSRSLRQDYFSNFRFCVPEIPPGWYTLWIRISEAGPGKRQVEHSLDFYVRPSPVRGS
jgi:hypothetical protein